MYICDLCRVGIIAVICMSITVASCKNADGTSLDIKNLDIEQCSQNDLNDVGLKIESTEFIVLETTDECLVGSVSHITCEDGNWFLVSKRTNLYKFDRNGKFLCSIGGQGNGPGEYQAINIFGIADGKVYIISGNQNKICVYSTDGEWIEDIIDVDCLKFAMAMTPIGNGSFLVANAISFKKDVPLYGLWNPADPKVLNAVEATDYSSNGSYEWAMKSMSTDGKNIYALTPLSGEIKCYDFETGKMSTAFSVSGIFRNKVPSEGDYSTIFKDVLKAKSSPIMTLCATGDYLILGMTRNALIWNVKNGRGTLLEGPIVSEESGIFSLFPSAVEYSDGKIVATVVSAENIVEHCEINNIPTPIDSLNEESNPVIVLYSFDD